MMGHRQSVQGWTVCDGGIHVSRQSMLSGRVSRLVDVLRRGRRLAVRRLPDVTRLRDAIRLIPRRPIRRGWVAVTAGAVMSGLAGYVLVVGPSAAAVVNTGSLTLRVQSARTPPQAQQAAPV